MTLSSLLIFMVLSQIAVSAYLLYSFNTIDRASRRRHEALTAHLDDALAEMEARITGKPRVRARTTKPDDSISSGREAELLQPRQAL